jgi:hypothetical protein
VWFLSMQLVSLFIIVSRCQITKRSRKGSVSSLRGYVVGLLDEASYPLSDTTDAALALAAFNDRIMWVWSGTDNPPYLYIASK